SDKIPVIVRQHLLGALLVIIQIDRVYTHTALRSHVRNRGRFASWRQYLPSPNQRKTHYFHCCSKNINTDRSPRILPPFLAFWIVLSSHQTMSQTEMSYHREERSRGEHGIRGCSGANHCPSAAPGTRLIWCLEAAVPVRR